MTETVAPPEFVLPTQQDRVLRLLERMAAALPQVLLLEGGSAEERLNIATYWALLLNCKGKGGGEACTECPECRRIIERASRDFFVFDGGEGKIKVEPVRELIPVFGEPPRGKGKRVVVFYEAQELTEGAANTLLKALEEPNQGTVFVLTAPQRERLLPTLVSRSWVVTLSPADRDESLQEVQGLKDKLVAFWKSGRGWFEITSGKGGPGRDEALALLVALEADLVLLMSGRQEAESALTGLDLSVPQVRSLGLMLDHAREALNTDPSPTTPTLVLDWLAVKGFHLLKH